HFHESLDVFVHNDSSPTLFAGEDGIISYLNRAAHTRFGAAEGRSLVMLLSAHAANPVNVVFRLQQKARTLRAAREDVVTENGHMRLSVHHIGKDGFIWRLEDLAEFPPPGGDSGSSGGLPQALVAENGRILFMNHALTTLAGRRVGHLDRLFNDLPLRPNGLHRIDTAEGVKTVRVYEIRRESGRREVYLLPVDRAEEAAGGVGRAFEVLPVAMIRLSADGNVADANRAARKFLGLNPGESPPLADLLRGLGRPIGDWLHDAAEGRTLNRPELVQAARRDHDVYLQITLSRVPGGDAPSLIAVLNDATELKTLEAQFIQSQKMQAIGQLAGGVAHDFNNLLTAISGYCDLLLLRHDEGDPDYGDLVQINQNANRAASLVNQLLAFSRKQNLMPERLDLRDLLSDLSHLLNRLIGEKVTLSVGCAEKLTMVRADKRQLEQVLMNLVVNARDAMPAGGDVRIDAEPLELTEELHRDRAVVGAGRYVSIRVADTGCGIAPERLGKIFEPFYTTKKTGEGTGLGLSMVYGIIKQTGGFIFVDSAPGQGTSFQILLPADESNATEAPAPPAPEAVQPAKTGGVVLLVEDEAPVRSFAARALRMRGYEVLEAASAEEALATLDNPALKVDVFVTDVIMPGKDGPTWVREALVARPDVRVVFVSGYAEESFADHQSRIAHSVFLPKPFSLQELVDKVRAQIAA
ncbi:MAG: response regulator, partial [Rhodobacteraceae bacterium]|nr:response regulator [Paracoccaceae bacterium]